MLIVMEAVNRFLELVGIIEVLIPVWDRMHCWKSFDLPTMICQWILVHAS